MSGGGPGWRDKLKAIWEYVKTVWGILSGIPTVLTLIDSWVHFFGISSAIKPEVYVLTLVSVAIVFLWEVGRSQQTTARSPEYSKMMRRAGLYVVPSLLFYFLFSVGTRYFEHHLPEGDLALGVLLWGLALCFAIAISQITRTLVVLGLKVYIGKHRP